MIVNWGSRASLYNWKTGKDGKETRLLYGTFRFSPPTIDFQKVCLHQKSIPPSTFESKFNFPIANCKNIIRFCLYVIRICAIQIYGILRHITPTPPSLNGRDVRTRDFVILTFDVRISQSSRCLIIK